MVELVGPSGAEALTICLSEAGSSAWSLLVLGVQKDSKSLLQLVKSVLNKVDFISSNNDNLINWVTTFNDLPFALIGFRLEAAAEVFVQACSKDEKLSFARNFHCSYGEIGNAAGLLLSSPYRVIYLANIPQDWLNRERLLTHFTDIVKDVPDCSVTVLHISPLTLDGYLEFSNDRVVDAVVYRCSRCPDLLRRVAEDFCICRIVHMVNDGGQVRNLEGDEHSPEEVVTTDKVEADRSKVNVQDGGSQVQKYRPRIVNLCKLKRPVDERESKILEDPKPKQKRTSSPPEQYNSGRDCYKRRPARGRDSKTLNNKCNIPAATSGRGSDSASPYRSKISDSLRQRLGHRVPPSGGARRSQSPTPTSKRKLSEYGSENEQRYESSSKRKLARRY